MTIKGHNHMDKTALFVRHKAKPGKRDDLQKVWEEYIKPRVNKNTNHEAYYFCYDNNDPDVICVFQLFSNQKSINEFMSGDWYSEYLKKVSALVADKPQINSAKPLWIK